jgi:type VII secretion protein EccE
MAKTGRKFGIRIRRSTAVWLSVVGVCTAETVAWFGRVDWRIAAAVIIAVVVPAILTYRNRTIIGWLRQGWRYRRFSRKSTTLISYEGSGLVWDGKTASMYLEMYPDSYFVSIVNPDGSLTAPAIPIDVIREELIQFDIHTDHVTVFTTGHKYFAPTRLSAIYHSVTGPVPALLTGRTFIEVSVALDGSLDSVYARMGNRTVPVGLGNTVRIASKRIKRRLNRLGWTVDILSRSQVKTVTESALDILAPLMRKESWQLCGDTSMSMTAHTPIPRAWTQSGYWEWNQFGVHRQISVLRLDRGADGADHAELYYCYIDSDIHALDLAEAVGLRREYGQQGNILTTVIPTAETVRPTEVPRRTLWTKDKFPFRMFPCGLGVFVGFGENRSQVYVNLSRGGEEPLYVVSPAAFVQQLVIRALTTGARVDIRIPGEMWEQFARHMKSPKLLGYNSIPEADIIVVPEDSVPDKFGSDQVVIAWSTISPAVVPNAIIVVSGEGCHVTRGNAQTPFQWTVTSGESRMLTAPVSDSRIGSSRRTEGTLVAPEQDGAGEYGRHAATYPSR